MSEDKRVLKTCSRQFRAQFRKLVLGRRCTGVLAETEQGLFIVDPADFSVSRELLTTGVYDPGEVRVFQSILTPESTLVVIGCHLGSLLVPLSKNVKRAIGFEPDPYNFRLLELNIRLNQCQNTTIHPLAVGENKQRVSIRRNPLNTGNSQVQLRTRNEDVQVQMVALDSFPGLDSATLLIMDIEGFEPAAIRGGRKLLSRTPFFSVEYCPKQLYEMDESPGSFIESIAEIYSHMYTIRHGVEAFTNHQWIDELKRQQDRPGLLLNLLFTNQKLELGDGRWKEGRQNRQVK